MAARGEALESEDELARLSEPAAIEKVVILEDRDESPRESSVRA